MVVAVTEGCLEAAPAKSNSSAGARVTTTMTAAGM